MPQPQTLVEPFRAIIVPLFGKESCERLFLPVRGLEESAQVGELLTFARL